jgi:hypothetical protein
MVEQSKGLAMHQQSDENDTDVSEIKQLMNRELSITWNRENPPDWNAFADTFLPSAALFPAARPVKTQALNEFIERMTRLRDEGKLESFEVTPLGCDVRIFANVAVAFAACEMRENGTVINREVNATVLVREDNVWRIAAQAWDIETDIHPLPTDLAR